MTLHVFSTYALSLLLSGVFVNGGDQVEITISDEMSFYREGDIRSDKHKMALSDNERLWRSGRLPYVISDVPEAVSDWIHGAIKAISDEGCVRISERTDQDDDYVKFVLGTDMTSYIGRQGGEQTISISKSVDNMGVIMHEIMHTLGFGHEHNRPDRDDYITVNFDNIKPNARSYFEKYNNSGGFLGPFLEYDYISLMHATNNIIMAVDPSVKIITRKDGGSELGQRFKLTENDKKRLKQLYSCDVCKPPESSVALPTDGKMFNFPGDCTKYIHCSNHYAYVQDCPSNLHFNKQRQICDYPRAAACTIMT
ncbi:zinc metalloproteinase nas-14-like isoform X2 [Oratosquilla oratoria]|uniref:zinc metalloproteinase nas-14-like isoform X2 n=1 Tax=Oratosquilla oratoria TaxID=337810 RepID=UPI003F7704E5